MKSKNKNKNDTLFFILRLTFFKALSSTCQKGEELVYQLYVYMYSFKHIPQCK